MQIDCIFANDSQMCGRVMYRSSQVVSQGLRAVLDVISQKLKSKMFELNIRLSFLYHLKYFVRFKRTFLYDTLICSQKTTLIIFTCGAFYKIYIISQNDTNIKSPGR